MTELQRVVIAASTTSVLRDDVYVVRAALLSRYSPTVHVLASLSLLLQVRRLLFQFLPLVLGSAVLKPYLYLPKTERDCFTPSNHHYIEQIILGLRLFISVVTALTFLLLLFKKKTSEMLDKPRSESLLQLPHNT